MTLDNILGVKSKNYGECGYCKNGGNDEVNTIYIPYDVYAEWKYVMYIMDDKEWGCLFNVEEVEGGYLIKDYFIPKQEVTGVSCEFKDGTTARGNMHSHHGMGAFASTTDKESTLGVHDFSLILSHKEIIGFERRELPCRGHGIVECNVEIIGLSDLDQRIKDNIIVKAYTYAGSGSCRRWNTEKGDWEDWDYTKKEEDKTGADAETSAGEEYERNMDKLAGETLTLDRWDMERICTYCANVECSDCPIFLRLVELGVEDEDSPYCKSLFMC